MSSIKIQFQSAYDAEVGALLQRRFRWWAGTWLILWLPWLAGDWRQMILCFTVIGIGGWAGSRRLLSIKESIRIASGMLITTAGFSICLSGFNVIHGVLFGAFLWSGFSLLLACLFLPMTFAQAARPAVVMLLLWIITAIWIDKLKFHWASPLIIISHASVYLPGLAVAAFRISRFGKRFESKMLRQHQEDYNREVFDAQKLHAALFPTACLTGPLQFRYVDLPRAGIGGDFLHAEFDAQGKLNLVVLDVTGDGISAALTVHRLQGELERVMAESADNSLAPDEALALLDRYVALTLAPHGIYGFALFFRIAADGRVEWSGAGHTPAFIRRADGTTEKLESTTWPLGAGTEPDPLQSLRQTRLAPADVLIIHTDGACRECNPQGKRLGYHGISEMIRAAPPPREPLNWPEHFIKLINEFRGTDKPINQNRQEDTLVVCVTRVENSPHNNNQKQTPAAREMVKHG